MQAFSAPSPVPTTFTTDDGVTLRGHWWHADGRNAQRPVVLVNAATSVRAAYYHRFATYLQRHGMDVLTYDYRGIGESRPRTLRGFHAGWYDWGRHDTEAAIQEALRQCPGQPLLFVGHSIGGALIGLAPSHTAVQRLFTMGAQFAHWPDYAAQRRLGLRLKWHLVMPVLTAALGYFPGQRLGWLEDTPRGVVRDWTAPAERLEDLFAHGRGSRRLSPTERQALAAHMARLQAPILALGTSDDEFGTPAALQRLLRQFPHAPAIHWHLRPQDLGVPAIGHFAFFHSRFERSLWPMALRWLQEGRLDENTPGRRLNPPAQTA